VTLGGAGKEVIDAWGIQEPLQDGSSHDTEWTLLDEGGQDGVQQQACYLQARDRSPQMR
jgi:hypothetical protein